MLLSAAAYILLSSLAGIDFAEVWDQLQDATWGLIVVALAIGQTPRFSQAESTRGACPRPVAYGPLVLCGDFNCEDADLISFLRTGLLSKSNPLLVIPS